MRTKRWNDLIEPDDGYRLLICRFRPRGVPRAAETWHAWCTALAPSEALHADAYGKHGPPLSFPAYAERFLAEMRGSSFWIEGFAARLRASETITLLCSSACVDETRCHRTLVKRLLEEAAFPAQEVASGPVVRKKRGLVVLPSRNSPGARSGATHPRRRASRDECRSFGRYARDR